METDILKKIKLQNEINLLPANKLDEVIKLITSIISKDNFKKAEPRNLSGIWKNKGFEKIEHLESEIEAIRHELSESILEKNS